MLDPSRSCSGQLGARGAELNGQRGAAIRPTATRTSRPPRLVTDESRDGMTSPVPQLNRNRATDWGVTRLSIGLDGFIHRYQSTQLYEILC